VSASVSASGSIENHSSDDFLSENSPPARSSSNSSPAAQSGLAGSKEKRLWLCSVLEMADAIDS
jgi:hypothetical protein